MQIILEKTSYVRSGPHGKDTSVKAFYAKGVVPHQIYMYSRCGVLSGLGGVIRDVRFVRRPRSGAPCWRCLRL